MNHQHVNESSQNQFSSFLYSGISLQNNSWIMSNYLVDHQAKSLLLGIIRRQIECHLMGS